MYLSKCYMYVSIIDYNVETINIYHLLFTLYVLLILLKSVERFPILS